MFNLSFIILIIESINIIKLKALGKVYIHCNKDE